MLLSRSFGKFVLQVKRMKNWLVFAAIFSCSFSFGQKKTTPPKLVVGIVVDQMCYEYLYRFYSNFGPNGFKRFLDKGTNMRNVTYNYVPTYTGPGHATVYTGTTPANHGIVANDWFHMAYGREVNCVEDTTVKAVGSTSTDGLCSPHFLRANTITDQLRLTYPDAKVVGLSIKDRGAILPSGHFPNGAYWYDYASGKFITSSHYKTEMPAWMNTVYTNLPFSKYANQTWNLLKDPSVYQAKEDNTPYEVLIGGKTTPTFPYDFTQKTLEEQYLLFTSTPWANTYLTDVSLAAMRGEQMGKDATTDFLTISYSTPDIVGHAFGPYSLELEDIYYRLDQDLASLFATLDKEVGKGQYTVFLTADHAVVPVPQYLTDHHLPGGYLFLTPKMEQLRKACVSEFGVDPIQECTNNNVYLKKEYLDHPSTKEMITFISNEISKWSEVKKVYSDLDISMKSPGDNWKEMVALGLDPERSGEVVFLLQPGYLTKSNDVEAAHKGTSHGSAFNYDTHVPVLFYGKSIPVQEVFTPYDITDLAATMVHILNVQRPNAMIGKPMVEVLKK